MRLIDTTWGRPVRLPGTTCVTEAFVRDLLQAHVWADGSVSTLCLDFAGEYVPLADEAELRLAAAMLCAYHNSVVRENVEVRIHIHTYI